MKAKFGSLIVLTVFLLATGSDLALAQTKAIGMAWAPIAGNGFSFRYLPVEGRGFQCGTVFWKDGGDGYVNLGAAALFPLKRSEKTALYVPVGLGYTYYRNTYEEWRPDNTTYEVREKESTLALGAGIGVTVRTGNWDDVWFSFDLVMMASKDDIMPMPQAAIHYYYK